VGLYLVHKMILPPELICMVKSSLTNQELFTVELTCRYLYWCTVSNKECQLRKCKLWNQSPSKIISEFYNARVYCSHVCCWKYRCQYLSYEDIKYLDHYAFRWAAGHGHLPVIQYLCEKFQLAIQDVRSYNNEALREAAENGHLPVVQYLCEYRDRENRQLTIQDVRSYDNGSLWGAAWQGHLPVVQYLCEYRDRENRQLTIQDVRSLNDYAVTLAARHLSVSKYLRQKYSIVE
jgi:ankyrin repeat protein